jgi:uncharacterized protein
MLPFKLVSADSHVVEPPDLWLKRIDRRYLEVAPRLIREADQDYFFVAGSEREKAGIGMASAAVKKAEELSMAERWENVLPGAYDPFARIQDMERDGIEAEFLYTSFGLRMFSITDLDYQFACFQAFNDWLANYCASFPKRLFGAAMIPNQPAARATAEMERCARMGLRAAMISVSEGGDKEYDNPIYERIWSASEDLGLPISLHLAASRKSFAHSGNILVDFSLGFTPAMYSVALMIFSGVFDRHPKLKVATVENDAGWAAMLLERMDFRYERDRFWAGPSNGITSGRLPSLQFREHVYCTFMRDHTAVRNREFIGRQNIMWGSDYPHQDSSFPNSAKIVAEHFAGVPLEDQVRIGRQNAIDLYNLPVGS